MLLRAGSGTRAREDARGRPHRLTESNDTIAALKVKFNGRRAFYQAANRVPDDCFPDNVDKGRYQPVEATGRGETQGVVLSPNWSVA